MPKVVRGSPHGESVHYGNAVEFSLAFEGGAVETFQCEVSVFAKLVAKLRSYGQLAEGVRRTMLGQPIEAVSAFTVSRVTNVGVALPPARSIAIQLATTEGIPLQIAMTPEQVAEAIERLKGALTQLSNPEGPSGLQ